MARAKYYTCNGQTMTLNEWWQETGVEPQVVKMRIRNGWSVEKAITTPNTQRRYELDGVKYSLKELAEMNPAISKGTIRSRIGKMNMSVYDAVFTPRMKKRSLDSPCGIPCFKCPYEDCHKK